jgi:hypothetical protein
MYWISSSSCQKIKMATSMGTTIRNSYEDERPSISYQTVTQEIDLLRCHQIVLSKVWPTSAVSQLTGVTSPATTFKLQRMTSPATII